MKKINLSIVTAVAVCNLFAQESGYVEMKMSSTMGATGNIRAYFSPHGQRNEFDMNSPQMPGGMHYVAIFKKENLNTMIRLNDADKTYTETDMSNKQNDNNTYTVKKIGEETVGGYKCVHSQVTDSRAENSDVWTSKEVPYYEQYSKMSQSNPRMGSSSSRDKAMKDAGVDGFPVKTISKSRDGEFTIELVKMEKKDFPAAMFEIPAGYTKSQGSTMTPVDMQRMTPEERTKYIQEMMQKKPGGK